MAITKNAALVGELGEEHVARFLSNQGFQILERNWRIREGELDLVATRPDSLIIFVEVKTRTSIAHGDPLEAINQGKALRIQRLALAWLATHGRLGSEYRIDVAGVLITRSGEFILDYREAIL